MAGAGRPRAMVQVTGPSVNHRYNAAFTERILKAAKSGREVLGPGR